MANARKYLSVMCAVVAAAAVAAVFNCGTRDDTTPGGNGPGGGDGGDAGNGGTGGTVVTIPDIQQGKVQEASAVAVENVIVTSPTFQTSGSSGGDDSFFVEDPNGGEYSGIMVFVTGGAPVVKPGDKVNITGYFTIYYGNNQIEVADGSGVAVKGTGAVPNPAVVNPADVKTGGPKTKNYLGCLVEVDDVAMENPEVLGTDGKPHGDFSVTGGLIVGLKFERQYHSKAGDRFAKIVGPLIYSWDQMRLLPRGDYDIVLEGGGTDGGTPDDTGVATDGGTQTDGGTVADGGTTEPTTVYDIQQGQVTEGATVTLKNVVVTGGTYSESGGMNGLWVQEQAGGDYSGILVVYYKNAGLGTFAAGDVVEVSGDYTEYYELSELSAKDIKKTGTAAVPAPVVVNAADIATNGSRAEKLEGVLVKVENVTVTDANPDSSGDSDHGEFVVTGDLRVDDDYAYDYRASRHVGDQFSAITGILKYAWDNFKIEPRGNDDLVKQ